MGQLEVQNGEGGAKGAAKDSTAGQRKPILSTGTEAGLPGGDGGAKSVGKDVGGRMAPSSTGSPDKLDTSHKVG